MELKKGTLPPLPKPVTPEEIRRVFEDTGFTTTSDKRVSVDMYDILAPLLGVLQVVQWWGKICEMNGYSTPTISGELQSLGIAVHASDKGQHVCTVPIGSAAAALNMPKAYVESLRRYGKDVDLRAERLADSDNACVQNENLDTIGETILRLCALVLPPSAAA